MRKRDEKGRFQKTELTEEDMRNIRMDFEKGMKIKDIRKKYHIGAKTSRKLLPRRRRKDLTKEEVHALIQDYENGMSVEELMKKHKVGVGTIYNHIKKRRKDSGILTAQELSQNPPPTNILYFIAGFMDGDGSIRIIPHRSRPTKFYTVVISASNANRDVIELLQKTFKSGHIWVRAKRNRREQYRWVLYNRKIIKVILELLMDKLIARKAIAKIVYEMIIAKEEKWDRRKQDAIYRKYKKLVPFRYRLD